MQAIATRCQATAGGRHYPHAMHPFGTLVRFIWRSSKRAAVFVVGVALLVVGFIMFVTPGPGIVLVVAGLAVLATEFAWAEHLLDKAKEQAAKAGRSAQKVPGVATVTGAAGRLVPQRWRRTTTVVAVEQSVDGTPVAGVVTVRSTTVAGYGVEPGEPAPTAGSGTAVDATD